MDIELLKSKCIGIIGAGGLGSNCAVSLARLGIGKLVIADFDVVTDADLSTQYYFRDQIGQKKVYALRENIQRINSSVIVEAVVIGLTPDSIVKLFAKCDIIVEAFEIADMKQMIIETVLSGMPDKYLVSGVVSPGCGNNSLFKTQQLNKHFICGNHSVEYNDSKPKLASCVGIVANMQANQVLELLMTIDIVQNPDLIKENTQ